MQYHRLCAEIAFDDYLAPTKWDKLACWYKYGTRFGTKTLGACHYVIQYYSVLVRLLPGHVIGMQKVEN